MHHLDPRQRVLRRPEGFEAQHRPNDPFHCPVILLDDIVEILRLAKLNGLSLLAVVALDCGCIGATLLNRDLFGYATEQRVPQRIISFSKWLPLKSIMPPPLTYYWQGASRKLANQINFATEPSVV